MTFQVSSFSLAQFSGFFVTMFRPLINFPAHVEYFGKGERPPLSALQRSVLILINFSKLRKFVARHIHKDHLEITSCDALPTMLYIDEESIYTYAKYLEPLKTSQSTSMNFALSLLPRSFRLGRFDFLSLHSISTLRICRATPSLFKDKTVFTKSFLFALDGFGNKFNLIVPPLLLMNHISPTFFDWTAQASHRNRNVQCKKRPVLAAS